MSSKRTSDRSVWSFLWWIPVIAVCIYVAIPIGSSIQYALFPGGSLSFSAYSVLTDDPTLIAAITRTLMVALLAIVVLILVLVPAVVAVHLWAPRLRPLLEVLCTLPLVVPPIALAAGFVALLRWAALQGRGSLPNEISTFLQNPDLPLVLVGAYVVLCLPFTFRSVDSGLRTIDLKVIVEASAVLGSSTFGTVWRVVIPNIRGPVLFSIFFATAICITEFAIAATLSTETISVWLFTVSTTDFRASIAVSVLLNLTTWILLIVATLAAHRFSPQQRQAQDGDDGGSTVPTSIPRSVLATEARS